MGEFRFWVTSKVMAESNFGRPEGSETVRFSGSQFRFAVSSRTGSTMFHGNRTERSKILRYPPSVQGFPITFSIDGKQYIAVPTGLGGGSPRNVPFTIAPDIHHPGNGNALYVFALPDKR